jgi:hypothetical protein
MRMDITCIIRYFMTYIRGYTLKNIRCYSHTVVKLDNILDIAPSNRETTISFLTAGEYDEEFD